MEEIQLIKTFMKIQTFDQSENTWDNILFCKDIVQMMFLFIFLKQL